MEKLTQMTKTITNHCDFCGKAVERMAAKIYLAPVLPGKSNTSYQSAYSHSADVCNDCLTTDFLPKMTKRQPRSNNGTHLKAKKG